jgi:hypothetical protein
LGIYFFCVSKLSIYLFNIEGKIGQLTVIRTSSFINQAINHLRDALYDGVYRFSSELVTFGFKNDLWSSFNVKNILLSMCDVKVFLTFTFVVKILQVTRGCWWRWFTIDVPPSSLNLVLLWQLVYLFCSSIVIHTVIVTVGTFEPQWKREVWRFKIWFNPPFL